MKIKCPYCKAYNFLKLDKININHIHKSNIEIKDFLVGEVAQINNIINICETDTINSINQLKNIKSNINSLVEKIEDTISEIKDIENEIEYIKKNPIPKMIGMKDLEYKSWGDYIKKYLFTSEDMNNNIYENILIKAHIFGKDSKLWACTKNFNLNVSEYEKIINLFEQTNTGEIKQLDIGGVVYDLDNYNPGISVDLKSGDIGGTIAKSKAGFIIGIYDPKEDCIMNELKIKQNLELCQRVVKDLAEGLKLKDL